MPPEHPRPVWLTREQIVQIELAARTSWYGMPQIEKDALLSVVKRYQDAPADAAEAIHLVLDGPTPLPDCTCGHKPEFCHKINARRWCVGGIPHSFATPSVLRALGAPDV